MSIHIESATDIGKARDHNEDAYLALGRDLIPQGIDGLLLVADGMGGHAAGEVASQMAVDGILDRLSKQTNGFSKLNDKEFQNILTSIIEEVNQIVWESGRQPAKLGMGTTCTLAAIRFGKLFLAQVGDSRAYLLRNGKLRQLTIDHSWVEEAVAQNILTREQARVHPNRNIITRAIGLDNSVSVDIDVIHLRKGDFLLLCSDGLNSMITDEEILKIIKDNQLSQVCNALIEGANGAGGLDNTTVIVAVIESDCCHIVAKLVRFIMDIFRKK